MHSYNCTRVIRKFILFFFIILLQPLKQRNTIVAVAVAVTSTRKEYNFTKEKKEREREREK